MTGEVKCRFCAYARQGQPDPVNQPWLASEEHFALVSKGALVPGWSLVCPRHHTHSLRDSYADQAFLSFAGSAIAHVREAFGDVCVFEHGAFEEGSLTGCGTDHSHLHVVPLTFSLQTEAVRRAGNFEWVECGLPQLRALVGDSEYLFVSDHWTGADTRGLVAVLTKGESQFFRRLIATRLGLGEFFDYRRFPMDDVARDTHRVLAQSAAYAEI